jgi:hypothetical protein
MTFPVLLPLLLLQVSVGGVTSVSLPGLVGLGPLVTLQQVEVGPGPAEQSFLQASVLFRAVLCRAVSRCAVTHIMSSCVVCCVVLSGRLVRFSIRSEMTHHSH